MDISFDETTNVEDEGKVRPSRSESMPRAAYIEGRMMEEYDDIGDCPGCVAKRWHKCRENAFCRKQKAHGIRHREDT